MSQQVRMLVGPLMGQVVTLDDVVAQNLLATGEAENKTTGRQLTSAELAVFSQNLAQSMDGEVYPANPGI